MAKQSKAQKETVERVMHDSKHGELESGSGRKVKNPKQAIAIALREAGASNQVSPKENKAALAKTKARERKGETGRDEREGKGRETRAALYAEARRRDIPNRSKMTRDQLAHALGR